MVFPLLTAALSTPPDIWCQIVARFLISLIIELAIFVALIVQVREEGWTSGMRERGSIKKGVAPLEPDKVTGIPEERISFGIKQHPLSE